MTEYGWLHLYAQHSWHDEASVCGDRDGIERLRDALTAALESTDGVAMCVNVFAADGEGYHVSVHVLPQEEFNRLACPYTDEPAREHSAEFWPCHLPVKPSRPTPTEAADRHE